MKYCRSVLEEQILADTYDGAYLVEVYEVLLSLYSELLVNKKHFKPRREVYEYIQELDMKYLWYQHWLTTEPLKQMQYKLPVTFLQRNSTSRSN